MNTKKDIFTITNQGKTPVILTGPHNGWNVPQQFIENGNPLGVEPYWFDPEHIKHRHEACDWGIQDLFSEIEKHNDQICLVSAHISRLIVDLNRIESITIYEASSETRAPIPGNLNLSAQHIKKRLENFYHPYHNRLDRVLQETKKAFGKVIWLDIHSFTPLWQGQKRTVGIGSLKMGESDFSIRLEHKLEETFKELFIPDHPYDLNVSPFREINAGSNIARRNDVEYFGIEIRSDLLDTHNQVKTMAQQLLKIIGQLD